MVVYVGIIYIYMIPMETLTKTIFCLVGLMNKKQLYVFMCS